MSVEFKQVDVLKNKNGETLYRLDLGNDEYSRPLPLRRITTIYGMERSMKAEPCLINKT